MISSGYFVSQNFFLNKKQLMTMMIFYRKLEGSTLKLKAKNAAWYNPKSQIKVVDFRSPFD
jgi:hypothetical protein